MISQVRNGIIPKRPVNLGVGWCQPLGKPLKAKEIFVQHKLDDNRFFSGRTGYIISYVSAWRGWMSQKFCLLENKTYLQTSLTQELPGQPHVYTYVNPDIISVVC